uniref:CRAL_TRIO_N domain-containing protein n=1 Tax=Ascaris lumbricoides TaxID=6252 RepID=A0A0M3HIV5_ASCLU
MMPPEQNKIEFDINDPKIIHKEQIDLFRMKVQPLLNKYPRYNTDYSLLRWLHAYKFDYDLAAQKMEWSLNAMDAVGIFEKDLSSVELIHKEVRNITPIAEYFPGGMLGFDKDGNVINMHTVGRARPQSLMSAERISRFFIGALMDCEGCATLIRFFFLNLTILFSLNFYAHNYIVFHFMQIFIYFFKSN